MGAVLDSDTAWQCRGTHVLNGHKPVTDPARNQVPGKFRSVQVPKLNATPNAYFLYYQTGPVLAASGTLGSDGISLERLNMCDSACGIEDVTQTNDASAAPAGSFLRLVES